MLLLAGAHCVPRRQNAAYRAPFRRVRWRRGVLIEHNSVRSIKQRESFVARIQE